MFLQFDIQKRFGLPFRTGSHFSAFMCPVHNDPPEAILKSMRLRRRYWQHRHAVGGVKRFYQLVLQSLRGRRKMIHPLEPHLLPQCIAFQRCEERTAETRYPGVSLAMSDSFKGLNDLKVGGQPHYVHGTDGGLCTCGARLVFLCQVPQGFGFTRARGAPAQPDTIDSEVYTLFLGNHTYFFACEAQCNPLAVHPFVKLAAAGIGGGGDRLLSRVTR